MAAVSEYDEVFLFLRKNIFKLIFKGIIWRWDYCKYFYLFEEINI